MNYVFFKPEIYEGIDDKDSRLLSIECVKVDNKFRKIDAYKNKIDLKDKKEKNLIEQLKDFVKGSMVIGYDLFKPLTILLTRMYYLKTYDFTFRYFDMKERAEHSKNISSICDMIKLMKEYSNNNLDNIKYIKNKERYLAYRVFRGLNYKLYLLDKGYYIYDKGPNREASFYAHKKEINKDWNYSDDEYKVLINKGAKFITNILHISNETIKYTDEYTVYSAHNLEKHSYMIEQIEKSLEFLDNNPNLKIKLVCIGDIERLKENYNILGEENLDKIIKLITREKELWSKW